MNVDLDAASHATEPPDQLSSSEEQSNNDPSSPVRRSNPFSRSRHARAIEFEEPQIDIHQPTCSIIFSTFEQALSLAGGWGRYHILLMLLMQLGNIQFAGNYMLMTLSVYQPQTTCVYMERGENYTIELNDTNKEEFCNLYDNSNCTQVIWTSKYEQTQFKTIIEEWGLICGLDHVPDLINSATQFGPLIILFIVSTLSDFYGRKRLYVMSILGLLACNVVTSMVQHWQTYVVARVLAMACAASAIQTGFLWAMELTPKSHMTLTNLAGLWHIAYMCAGAVAYITDGWRQYLIAFDLLAIPLLSIALGFVESPSWLIQNGHLEEAAAALTNMAKFNRRKAVPKFTPLNLNSIKQQGAGGRARLGSFDSAQYNPEPPIKDTILKCAKSIFQFLLHKRTIYYLWVMSCLTIGVSAASNSYIFQMSRIKLDPHLMIIIYGAIRLVVMPPIIILDHKLMSFGRRDMACVSQFLATVCFGVALTCQLLWPSSVDEPSGAWRDWALMLCAAVSCNFIYVVNGQYIVELYPTVQRNRIAAILTFIDSLTAIVMPQVVYLENYWPNVLLLFSTSVCAIAFLTTLTFAPETKGKPLPDDFSEEEILLQFTNEELMQCKLWCHTRNVDNNELLRNMEDNEGAVET